jgi:hypothetical protein
VILQCWIFDDGYPVSGKFDSAVWLCVVRFAAQ